MRDCIKKIPICSNSKIYSTIVFLQLSKRKKNKEVLITAVRRKTFHFF